MWYWIKSPAGEQTDYNFEELKAALAEGKVAPDWLGRRHDENQWIPVRLLAEQDAAEESAEIAESPSPYISLVCGKCDKVLRLELPIEEAVYTCPQCRTEYHATKVSTDPLTFVLMPNLKRTGSGA